MADGIGTGVAVAISVDDDHGLHALFEAHVGEEEIGDAVVERKKGQFSGAIQFGDEAHLGDAEAAEAVVDDDVGLGPFGETWQVVGF